MCGGLNVPPKIPRRAKSGTGLPETLHHVLEGAELADADRAARVELLGRVAHLGAHAELAAVREARRRVDIDARRVDARGERARGLGVVGEDGVGVTAAVDVDVLDRL